VGILLSKIAIVPCLISTLFLWDCNFHKLIGISCPDSSTHYSSSNCHDSHTLSKSNPANENSNCTHCLTGDFLSEVHQPFRWIEESLFIFAGFLGSAFFPPVLQAACGFVLRPNTANLTYRNLYLVLSLRIRI